MTIDDALEHAYRTDPERTVDVVLTARAPADDLRQELEQHGFKVTNSEHAAHGILYGRMHLRRLPELRRLSGIDSITLDSPQHAF